MLLNASAQLSELSWTSTASVDARTLFPVVASVVPRRPRRVSKIDRWGIIVILIHSIVYPSCTFWPLHHGGFRLQGAERVYETLTVPRKQSPRWYLIRPTLETALIFHLSMCAEKKIRADALCLQELQEAKSLRRRYMQPRLQSWYVSLTFDRSTD